MGERHPLIVTLAGEWDIYRRSELEALMRPALDHARVVLDLSAVTYADSTILSVLASLRKARLERGFAASALIPSPSIERLLAITRMNRLWPCFGTLEKALDALDAPALDAHRG